MRAARPVQLLVLLVLALLLSAGVSSGQPAGGAPTGPPPGFIPEVDPAEYVLLKADVPATWTWTPPTANQEAQGTGITQGGRQETQSWWRMICEQMLLVPVTGPNNNQRFITFNIVGTVLKSPEYAKAGWDRWLGGGKPPINLPEGLVEYWSEGPCVPPYGEESAQGRVRNKPVAVLSFRYKAYCGHVCAPAYEFESPEAIAAAHLVARTLLAKITRAKLPVFNGLDIAILPNEWSFYPTFYGDRLGIETAADRHHVVAIVRNLSDKVPAQEVQVQLWLGEPGREGCQTLGAPVTIKDLGPHRWQQVNLIWPLAGNVENAPLYVQALPTTQEDVDPTNNAAGTPVSIYYAHNGSRAYSLSKDAYSFENWNMDPNDTEEAVEAWLGALVGHMQADARVAEVMQRIIFPQTLQRFVNYLDASATQGVGGHCYGMSSTSALYFQGELQRPGADTTAALTRSAASFNINIYHLAQMRTLMDAALSGDNWHPYPEGMQQTVTALRDSLRDQRKPLTVEFFGAVPVPGQPGQFTSPGHAVLAYKLVQWGDKNCLYLYDSNHPPPTLAGKAMPCFTFNMTAGNWTFPNYMGYGWANSNWVSAQPLTRQIPETALNSLVPRVKELLAATAKILEAGNKLLGVVRCPAETTITDEQGRSIGFRAGKGFCTIPGARILAARGAQAYLLPAGGRYSVAITRTGPGDIGFDMLHSEGGNAVGVVSYNQLPASGPLQFSVARDGRTVTGQAGAQPLSPSLTGSFDGTKVKWQTTTPAPTSVTPTTPPVAKPSATTGTSLTICTRLNGNDPADPGTRFVAPAKVYCFLRYTGLTAGETVSCDWVRDGRTVMTSKQVLKGGEGWMWFSFSAGEGQSLMPGAYSARVYTPARTLATQAFTVQ